MMILAGSGGCRGDRFKASSSGSSAAAGAGRKTPAQRSSLHLPPSVGNGWVRPTGEGEGEKEVRGWREREGGRGVERERRECDAV